MARGRVPEDVAIVDRGHAPIPRISEVCGLAFRLRNDLGNALVGRQLRDAVFECRDIEFGRRRRRRGWLLRCEFAHVVLDGFCLPFEVG